MRRDGQCLVLLIRICGSAVYVFTLYRVYILPTISRYCTRIVLYCTCIVLHYPCIVLVLYLYCGWCVLLIRCFVMLLLSLYSIRYLKSHKILIKIKWTMIIIWLSVTITVITVLK